MSAATPDGNAVFVDQAADNVVFLAPDGTTHTSPALGMTDAATSITSVGADTAVLTDPDGDIVVATPGRPAARPCPAPSGDDGPLVLQQPGAVRRRRRRGHRGRRRRRSVPLGGRRGRRDRPARRGRSRWRRSPSAGASSPWRRARRRSPSGAAAATATWTETQREPLDGAGVGAAPAARQRLGLDQRRRHRRGVGDGPQQRLDRVEDWGNILSDLDDESDDDNTDEDGGEVLTEVNPDDPNAEIVQSDEIDTEGPNRPPIARDDEAQTRVDRPIDVDVLLNDTDPNGDVLVVTAVEPAGGDARHRHRPRRAQRAGLARPPATPGRSRSATRSPTAATPAPRRPSPSTSRPSDGSDNRPPEAHNDIASTRRGRPTTFDVLANDVDPDGDALVLDSIAPAEEYAGAGVLVPDPSGQVVFTPDPNTTTGAHRADVHGQRRLRRHRRRHGDRRRAPRGRQQRARRPQRRRRHRRRQAGPARTCWRTTPTPTTTRCSSPSCRRWSARPTAPSTRSTCR